LAAGQGDHPRFGDTQSGATKSHAGDPLETSGIPGDHVRGVFFWGKSMTTSDSKWGGKK